MGKILEGRTGRAILLQCIRRSLIEMEKKKRKHRRMFTERAASAVGLRDCPPSGSKNQKRNGRGVVFIFTHPYIQMCRMMRHSTHVQAVGVAAPVVSAVRIEFRLGVVDGWRPWTNSGTGTWNELEGKRLTEKFRPEGNKCHQGRSYGPVVGKRDFKSIFPKKTYSVWNANNGHGWPALPVSCIRASGPRHDCGNWHWNRLSDAFDLDLTKPVN